MKIRGIYVLMLLGAIVCSRGLLAAEGEKHTWAFEPPVDKFTSSAMLDLRSLNEKTAGATGFIRLSKDGMGFVRGDGKPIRFWSVCSYGYRLSPEGMDRHCRTLAKLGVNMLRLHSNIAGTKKGQAITDVNQKEIDDIHRFVSIARKHGMYLTISPYWYHHKLNNEWIKTLKGYKIGDMPTGALFFNPEFQDAYKGWVRKLYDVKNPHTGLKLSEDPAVAIVQIKNEDSLLFWTSQGIPAAQQRILGGLFGDWLKQQYGSLAAAKRRWGGLTLRDGQGGIVGGVGDDFDSGIVGMYIIWHMTQPARGGMDSRLTDQLQFMAWRQRKFYADMVSYYRDELGCKQLTNAMNWKSADKMKLDDAERWSYTACDVMAVNRYAGGVHVGKNNGYRIDPGHNIVNTSLLRNPLRLPTNLKQIVGRPMMITESTWVQPNLYQSEGPMLAAAYMSLTGVDSIYWFAQGESDWQRDPRRKFWPVRRGPGGYAIAKWSCATPMLQGMFPANALLFRRGYLKQGKPVVVQQRSEQSLWRRRTPVIAETETFDPNRDLVDLRGQVYLPAAGGQARKPINVSRLAFLVGPVHLSFGKAERVKVADISRYVDAERKTVTSNTGEISLDWSSGLCKVDSPRAQGVTGFCKAAGGRFELGDVTIECDNEYAAVTVVSLDDKPLSQSERVLVQVGTTARLTDWAVREASFKQGKAALKGLEIVRTGQPPYRVRNTEASIMIKNSRVTRATLLDVAGYPVRQVTLSRTREAASVKLPPETMYLILHKE